MPEHSSKPGDSPRVVVFAPSPWLETEIERVQEDTEIHFHPAGQGFWVSRLLKSLGLQVTMCTNFGGEAGIVLRVMVEQSSIDVRAIVTAASNGAYVRDRRGTQPCDIANTLPAPFTRHEVDDLYGITLVEGLEANVVVLAGSGNPPGLRNGEVYARLAADLRTNGRCVVADLMGDPLQAALSGGVSILKISSEELIAMGLIQGDTREELIRVIKDLSDGADHVIVSRADAGAIALLHGKVYEAETLPLRVMESRGAGDSLTAGLAAGVARGQGIEEALRLGMSAGALNVTRRGLASGTRTEIERLSKYIRITGLS